jgi:hypothetical protein
VEDFRKLTSQQQSQQQAQGQPIDWQQPHDAIRDFNKQTETQLRQRLGDERFEKLQRAGVLQFGGPAAGRE